MPTKMKFKKLSGLKTVKSPSRPAGLKLEHLEIGRSFTLQFGLVESCY